ncbi:flagellar assembly protein FliH [Burkholderia territorii]|uniref:flagellar assembly protein FliH n=1 Tax=Burkholderia territorii TaxID=1503055 RepID=UPI00075E74DE|nr:flagellar assembly protein FliH [Burkholderia territorii]KWH08485.1 flagellar assembly protein FliH [Burkholderia territorii]
MRTYYPYRFPSLKALRHSPASEAVDVPSQESIDAGFQQGMERGYDEGLRRGEADGRALGREEGLAAGARESRDALNQRFSGLADTVDAMLVALQRVQDEYQAARRTELVDLVARVAKQVIRCELTLQPSQLLALVEETLAAMPAVTEDPEVHLNPEECARLADLLPTRASHWKLVADARLELGECRVKLGAHEADAGCQHRLDACMEQVGKRLLGASDSSVSSDETEEAEAS